MESTVARDTAKHTMQNENLRELVNEIVAECDISFDDADIVNVALPVIRKEIEAAIAKSVTVVTVKGDRKPKTEVKLGLQHKLFPELLAWSQVRGADGLRLNIWLAGPAGSGKTTAARNVARALNMKFYFNGAIDAEHKLLGFVDAQGRIVSRPFREAFVNGGVYLFDEVDGSFPAALLAFNAALANGHCDFPDGCFERHPDFLAIAAGNTVGEGSSEYVGRMKQDKAFLDRFVFMVWDIDEEMETQLAASLGQIEWAREVQAYRARAAKHGIRVCISPRSTYNGAAMLNAGILKDQVVEATVRKGMQHDAWQRIVQDN